MITLTLNFLSAKIVSKIQINSRSKLMDKLSKKRLRPIRDEVYSILRDDIIMGVYKPGDRLQEENLAENLGISRTPVREALRKLEIENLVDYYPHRGTVVSEIAVDELKELFLVKIFIEILINKKAAKNAEKKDIEMLRELLVKTEECSNSDEIIDFVTKFNNAVFKISNSEYLVNLNKSVRESIKRVVTSNALDDERRAAICREHSNIVDAFEDKDENLIKQYTIEHIQSSYMYFQKEPLELKDDILEL